MSQCPQCKERNDPGFKFCAACGTELPPPQAEVTGCPQCGAENEADLKFCGECGASLLLAMDAILAESHGEEHVESPVFRLFDNISVFIATFFGGPLAGAILIARNYSLLGAGAAAMRAVAGGIVGTALLILIGNMVPAAFQLPVAISGVAATASIARALQGSAVERHVRQRGRLASRWLAFGIGVGIGAPVVFAIYEFGGFS